MNNPKFDSYIKQKADQHHMETPTPRYGIISSYDPSTNTATVILSAPDSDGIEQIINRVPCPVYPGIATAAPEPGRPCFVTYLSARNESRPIITHYFNHLYQKRDYHRATDARNGVSQFYLDM